MNNSILVICPFFYGYQYYIKIALSKKYRKVFLHSEIPLENPKTYFIIEKIPILRRFIWEKYEKNLVEIVKKNKINNVLIIRGNLLSEKLLYTLRFQLGCKIIQYQWDSVKNNPNAMAIIKYTERNLTFDPSDADNIEEFEYLPLFYCESEKDFEGLRYGRKLDILFLATWNFDRLKALYDLKKLCKVKKLRLFSHIVMPFQSYIRRIHKIKNLPFVDIKFGAINRKKYLLLLYNCSAVFDMPSKTQVGTTMRTIEALAMRKKVITTNKNVIKEVFYNEDNILIWPDELFRIDSFLKSPYNDESLPKINSLDDWLLRLGV